MGASEAPGLSLGRPYAILIPGGFPRQGTDEGILAPLQTHGRHLDHTDDYGNTMPRCHGGRETTMIGQ
jgi:hypothetical protein